jgi:predicted outer membrane protein
MRDWKERAIIAETALQTMAALFPDEVWEQYADEQVTKLKDRIMTLETVIALHREDARQCKEEVIYLRGIVGSLVEYAKELLGDHLEKELLVDHLERYCETTKKNREWAKMLRDDIAAAKKALQEKKEEG